MIKEETYKDLDHLIKKWRYEIRGLHEVETNERGVELIGNAEYSMVEMCDCMKRMVSDLEMRNAELMLALDIDNNVRREHWLMKQALKNQIALDELGKQFKEKIRNGKA